MDTARPGAVADVHGSGRLTARKRLSRLLDQGSFIEYGVLAGATSQADDTSAADGLVAGTGLIAGEPVAAGSYDSTVLGAIDSDASDKAAKFVELCDAFDLPLVSLIDNPGYSVPLFSIQIRRGYGLGPALMAGYSSARGVPPLCLAWPTIEVGRQDGFATVQHGIAIDDVVTPAETREKIARTLRHIKQVLNGTEKKYPIDTW